MKSTNGRWEGVETPFGTIIHSPLGGTRLARLLCDANTLFMGKSGDMEFNVISEHNLFLWYAAWSTINEYFGYELLIVMRLILSHVSVAGNCKSGAT